MSALSGAGLLPPDQASAYVSALLGLLGSRDPMIVLQDTPSALRATVERLTQAQLDEREAPGKWSSRMVVQHLADSELVGAFRLRMILAENRPPILPYDQDRWAEGLHYQDADVSEALDQFAVLRRVNLKLWIGTSVSDLSRVGIHGERGEESLERMRRLYAGHDLAHLRQLERICSHLPGRRAVP